MPDIIQATNKLNVSVSVVVPALNEAGNIPDLVKRLHDALSPNLKAYEVIFVDDHSTDSTRSLIEFLAQKYPVKFFLKDGPHGKAKSLWQGFEKCSYELIATMDADLQYRPEDIPGMVEKLLEGYDLIQSRRTVNHQKDGLRNLAHKVFNFFFIRLLHGLDFDTQSCLKVFYGKILSEIKSTAATPWTFDLEFLIKARHAGCRIGSHNITFENRAAGESKINIFKQTWEIGFNAVRMKFLKLEPVAIPAQEEETMFGAGQAFKGKRYITHSTLPYHKSALKTLVGWQKNFVLILLSGLFLSFFLFPLKTAIAITAILSCIYFLDVLFNFFLVYRSLNQPPEMKFSESEILALKEKDLPVYSILCPLYREASVLPDFLHAIDKLDWPKNKLDVLLLLEEDDSQTIDAAGSLQLPDYVKTLIIPHSTPKTKPKACNFGLNAAKGEYLVVYDAEDIPEPLQLKKAYLGFQKVSSQIKCLQAKLNYFNPNQNFLTRLFTAEYSLWFDIILPGLQSVNGYIPLGGTSNHFRTLDLIALHGWDPFNVTEDCDLGARLFKEGFKTAIIDSTTLEEANSNLKNWIRQRSRWIKGYMQTYLVHMRNPVKFFQESGIHALIFQLVVGGKIAFLLINPVLWAMTILYFVLRSTVGSAIEALYPPAIFYIAVTSLLIGNFLCLYYYMLGCAKRGQWALIKYVYLIPLYWFIASIAGLVALYQLIVKPHFWEKTHHGLHLAKQTVPIYVSEFQPVILPRLKEKTRLISQSTILVGAIMIANVCNFLFNAFLGRRVSLEELATVALISNLSYLANIFIGSVATTVNHRVSYLNAVGSVEKSDNFVHSVLKNSLGPIIVLSLLWLGLSKILTEFFNLPSLLAALMFTPIISFGLIGSVNKGYLQGRLKFNLVAALVVIESASKLLFATILVFVNLPQFVYFAIPLSIIVAALFSIDVKNIIYKLPKTAVLEPFPVNFFGAAIFNTIATTVFLSIDVILAKHYLPAAMAGSYVLLSLVGKMVYFAGSLPGSLMITFVSRDSGLKKNPKQTFHILMACSAVMVLVSWLFLGIWGDITVPFLLGSKTLSILPFLRIYVLSLGLFTLSTIIVTYHLARKQFEYSLAALLTSLLLGLLILIDHGSILSFVRVIFITSLISFGLQFAMHMFEPQMKRIRVFVSDALDLFKKIEPVKADQNHKRILIFNWRDTRHIFAGGAEVYIHELAKKWVIAGHKVTVFCGNDAKSPREEIVDGVNIVRRGGFYLVYFWAVIYYLFRFRGKFDVIIDCENGIPFFTPLYAKEPVLCVIHHVHQEIFRRYLSAPLAMVARFLEKVAMPVVYKNTKFITVSPSTKQQMEELGLVGTGIEIVYNGVDLNKFIPGPKSPTPMILYLGRLKQYKSIDVLLRAFQFVVDHVPDAQLMIAGSGEEEGKLKKLAIKLGISESVAFTGRMDENEKISLLQKAWIFVNPSFIEGWGITTIEANACGVPVVAADVPGLRDSVCNPHTGLLVRHGDFEGFASAIIELIGNDDLRNSMGQQAYAWAQNFDWSKTSKEFLNVLEGEKTAANAKFAEESGG